MNPAERLLDARARRHSGAGFALYELPGFLSGEDCAALVAAIDHERSASQIFVNRTGADPQFRTSETCWLDHSDPQVARIHSSICALLGIDPAKGEALQGQHYSIGQHFKPHCDWFDPSRPYWEMEQKRGGQRSWTAMVYLDAPHAGGQTRFPSVGIDIAPKAGTLLAWNNLDQEGQPNPKSLHEGCPVLGGEKHIITLWFRLRPCRRPGLLAAARRSTFKLLNVLRRRTI